MNKNDFGLDFHWGVSTSAYQVEGGHDADGKGPSIWDHFTAQKGKILQGDNGKTACDFYNKYEKDLNLMASMGIKNFRFSLSWPRIIPEGRGKVNPKGILFYNKLVNKCLELGITPWVTLYHWDLPLALGKKGGWANRDILYWFSEYAKICARYFGDRVKHWIILNEPLVFTGAGYFFGVHAPGRKNFREFLAAVHHACLCQAEGGRIVRENCKGAVIGTSISCSHIDAYSSRQRDVLAQKRMDALLNRLFIEPALGLGYPVQDLKALKALDAHILPNDKELLRFDFDFWGIQNYTREVVKHAFFAPYLKAKILPAEKRKVPQTLMKWEIYPEGIYYLLKKYAAYPQVKQLVITENGAAFPDEFHSKRISDPMRTQFLKDYLAQVKRAKREGIPVKGYFVWSFLDNFEWAEGYLPRFGLVHVDFKTQKRTLKESGIWYSKFLKDKVHQKENGVSNIEQ